MKNTMKPVLLGLMLAASAIVAGAPLAGAYAAENTSFGGDNDNDLTESRAAFKADEKAEATALKATFKAQIVAAKGDKTQLKTIRATQKVTMTAFKADLKAEVAAFKAAHK